MSEPPLAGSPPRFEGRRVVLEPVHPGELGAPLRVLFLDCSERVRGGADPESAWAQSASAVAAGECLAWTISCGTGEPVGLAWLAPGRHLGGVGGPVAATLGIGWRNGHRPPQSCVTEVVHLLGEYAFDVCAVHTLTVRRPTSGMDPAAASAPILRGEWPALRASLQARLAG